MSKLNNFFITLTSIYYKYYKIDEKELFDRYSYATSGDEYGRNSKDTILSQERTLLLGYGGLICIIIDKTSDIYGGGSDFTTEEIELELSLPESCWYPVNYESISNLY